MSRPHAPGADVPSLPFPCPVDIKVMGRQHPEFATTMRALVARHVPPDALHAVNTRMSRQHQYISVTLSITATGHDQPNAIYQDLSACAGVLFTL